MTITHLIIERGPHRGKFGWMRGTWQARLTQAKNWGVAPGSQKIYVHGVAKTGSLLFRFGHVREASTLEVCMKEQGLL